MTDCRVRGFRREDASSIVRLHDMACEWFEEFPVTEAFIVEASLRPDFRLFVAESQRNVVGFAGALYQEHVGRAELGPISVDPGLQRTGVGSRLIERLLEFLKEKGIHRVVVRVKSSNKKARKFFQDRGFAKEVVLKNYTKKGEDVTQLVLFL